MSKNDKAKEEYFNWTKDTGGLSYVKNEDLICKDCKYKTDMVDTCKIYKGQKPIAVLDGEGCEKYEKK